jgi:hypothetical protein
VLEEVAVGGAILEYSGVDPRAQEGGC